MGYHVVSRLYPRVLKENDFVYMQKTSKKLSGKLHFVTAFLKSNIVLRTVDSLVVSEIAESIQDIAILSEKHLDSLDKNLQATNDYFSKESKKEFDMIIQEEKVFWQQHLREFQENIRSWLDAHKE